MDPREVRCRCCGIPVGPVGLNMRTKMRVCMWCDDCDGMHGQVLQGVLTMAVRDGKLAPGVALSRALIDDAQLTGRLVFDVVNGEANNIRIIDPPARWFVVAARAVCRNEMPDFASLADAVLGAMLPCNATRENLDKLAAGLTEAFRFVDPSVMAVVVDSKRDSMDPQHLIITIQARTPTMGQVMPGAEGIEIPADVLKRRPAQA